MYSKDFLYNCVKILFEEQSLKSYYLGNGKTNTSNDGPYIKPDTLLFVRPEAKPL